MRLINHLKPDPVLGENSLDMAQFTYFKLIIVSCETDEQCRTAMDWIRRLAGRTYQYVDLQLLIDERRAEIAGKGYYVSTITN